MTRYTKLEKKRHVKAEDQFDVKPLQPKKQRRISHKDDSIDAEPSSAPASINPRYTSNSRSTVNKDQRKRAQSTATDPEKAQKDAEKRKTRRQAMKEKNTICFGCRQKGHSLNSCPESKNSAKGICYNCGSTEHPLSKCRKPRKSDELPYAKCFVCKKQGHLSGKCPENDRGLYPNGGGCRFCGQVDHLAKDCKLTKKEAGTTAVGKIDLDQGADDDDYHIFVDEKQKMEEEIKANKSREVAKPKKKIVKF